VAGYSVILADTAGLRATDDPIEAEGVRRATAWAANADLRLWVVDVTDSQRPQLSELITRDDLIVFNKADALSTGVARFGSEGVYMSALDDGDVDRLRERLAARVVQDLSGAEFPSATRTRHAEALTEALDAVRASQGTLHAPELAAEGVRRAAFMLERITGRVEVEQVLGRVFATFCIGK
jgi:tRNA modification GTPase